MKLEQYTVGPVMTNCYFAINEKTNEALVIDPGAAGKQLAEKLRAEGITPKAILLTHAHFDHADGVEDFKSVFDIPVYIHEAEKETLEDPNINLSGMMGRGTKTYHADKFLKDEETFTEAGFTVKTLLTPGHTPGGCCYYLPEEQVLFSGDTLFCGSVGRTDFPKGSMSTLTKSIREKLLPLPEETKVCPGHDSMTTIGDELRYNPYLSQ